MTVASATVSVTFVLVTFSADHVALLFEVFETVEVVASVALFSIFPESTTASEAFTKASEAFTMASEAFTMTSVLETFTADQVELSFEMLNEFEVSEVSVEVLVVEEFGRGVHRPVTENAVVKFKRFEAAIDELVAFEASVTDRSSVTSNRRFRCGFISTLPPPLP